MNPRRHYKQISEELLNVSLDAEDKVAVETLTVHLKDLAGFIGVQCNPVYKELTVCMDLLTANFTETITLIPKEWKGYKVFSYSSGG